MVYEARVSEALFGTLEPGFSARVEKVLEKLKLLSGIGMPENSDFMFSDRDKKDKKFIHIVSIGPKIGSVTPIS